jgi:ParB family chromosome partitioning protein
VSEKRRGLGRGLGALIPAAAPTDKPAGDRPVDVFFPERDESGQDGADGAASSNGAEQPAEAKAGDGADPAAKGAADSSGGAQPKKDTSRRATAAGRTAIPPLTTTSSSSTGGAAAAAAAAAGPELVPVPGARFAELPTGSISPNPKQPRQVFDEEAQAELVHSVREIGVLQPIVVRPTTTEADGEQRYELIMGERRWRAVKEAGLERIPAIIRDTSDDDLLRDALLENLHRSELNPLEEAAAYQQLLEDFGCTHEELATRIGRSRPQISNTIRLLRLPPAVQRRVAAGVLSAGHARALLGLEGADSMDKLAQRIVNEGLSVRATEEAVALSDSDTSAPVRRKPRPGGNHAELDDLAGRLADRLDTRVNISLGRNKGKLSVEFASVEDLNRILEILVPDERGAFKATTTL